MQRAEQPTAVVIFEGDRRLDEKRKNLPPRFLRHLHEHLERLIEAVSGVTLYRAVLNGSSFTLASGSGLVTSAETSRLEDQLELSARHLFAAGHERVLFLGGDTLDLESSVIRQAISELSEERRRAVIGPSFDGGFYLIGMNAEPSVDWSELGLFTSEAARLLELNLKEEGFRTSRLPSRPDVDSIRDAIDRLSPLSPIGLRLFGRIASHIGQPPVISIPGMVSPTPLRGTVLLRAPPPTSDSWLAS